MSEVNEMKSITLNGTKYNSFPDREARAAAASKLPGPASAVVGQYLVVEEVDADGKITKVKTVEVPTGGSDSGQNNDREVLPNIVLFGDSTTSAAREQGRWADFLPNYAPYASLRNYARGTATWTFKTDTVYDIASTGPTNTGDNVIWNQFNRLKSDVDNVGGALPDAIIILGGANDILQSKPLGDISTAFSGSILDKDVTTLTTLAQSIRYVCECIKQEYPMCQIILVTPWKNSYQTDGGVPYRDMIVSCAQMLSERYIDAMYECGIYQYFETTGYVFRTDGVHLNDLGADKFAQYMARELCNKVNLRQSHLAGSGDGAVTLLSISATYRGGEVAVGTAVTALTGITVIATYSDESKSTVTGYTLSGTIAEGNNTITVSYGGKTTSFVVVGVADSGDEENPTPATYTITNTLTNVTNNNSTASVTEGEGYVATLTAAEGCELDSVTVTMGGVDVTATAYSGGVVNIASVTGNVVITATAVSDEVFHNYDSKTALLDTTSSWTPLGDFNPASADAFGTSKLTKESITNVYTNAGRANGVGRLYVCAVNGNPDGTASVALTIRKVVDYTTTHTGINKIPVNYENAGKEELMVLNAYGGARYSGEVPSTFGSPYRVQGINAKVEGATVTAAPAGFAIAFAYTTPQ